ncbi:bifunctional DNA-formamidopyrimidine glycosylase/DNA-(apurinic or apyrimidinic site) lyase [Acidithiobacillus sp. IBUN Pt1247-S3]|uniref:bifunctional DNA-formamidopyrimidine glycosylase/DNA-(apurinic or apyrimidinic site) lyase n=1 Tax=Acidithiobacillus sp. IBUN Pt1247-S3 TaxID=3166642 RepID=UPI0034E4D743
MPELPEVEVTRLGIEPHLVGRRIVAVMVRESRLRRPVNSDLATRLQGQSIRQLRRRGKYLVAELDQGQILLHLGMSGHLRILPQGTAVQRHDHIDLVLDDGNCLRFHDPRRFGLLLWGEDWASDPLLRSLGPEPLGSGFDGDYLFARSRGHHQAIKSFLMDSHVVVGVGNIYANESLFRAGIDPRRTAGRVALPRYRRLAEAIVEILQKAIAEGGTTLRDFTHPDGEKGYFRLSLSVYGRENEPCVRCGNPLRSLRIGGRSSFFCGQCQR